MQCMWSMTSTEPPTLASAVCRSRFVVWKLINRQDLIKSGLKAPSRINFWHHAGMGDGLLRQRMAERMPSSWPGHGFTGFPEGAHYSLKKSFNNMHLICTGDICIILKAKDILHFWVCRGTNETGWWQFCYRKKTGELFPTARHSDRGGHLPPFCSWN